MNKQHPISNKKYVPKRVWRILPPFIAIIFLTGLYGMLNTNTTHAQNDITRTWYIDNIRFDSGAVATGSFDYNTNPYNPLAGLYGTYSNIQIDVTHPDGTVREFRSVNRASRGNEKYLSLVAAEDNSVDLTGVPFLALTPAISMTNEGGVIDILPGPANLSYLGTCRQANCGPADGPYEEANAGGRIIAGPRTWHIDNVVFDSGAVATGSFVYDEEPYAPLAGLYGSYSNIKIDVTSPDGTVRKFRSVNRASRGNEKYLSLVAAVDNSVDLTGIPFMALTPAISMTNRGGIIDILPGPQNLSYLGFCRQSNCGPADSPYEEANAGGRIISNPGLQRWYLEGIRFDSGAVATGYFDYDEMPYAPLAGLYGTYSNININVTHPNGSVREFRSVNRASRGNEKYLSLVAVPDNSVDLTGVPFMALTPAISMTNVAGPINILPGPQNLSYLGTCRQANCGPADSPYEEANAGGRIVREVAPPTIVSGNSANAVEGETAVIDVESTDNLDTEGNGLVYSISGGADQALFNIGGNTGLVTFINAPNYDNPADAGGDNVYNVQVTVTDLGGRTAVQDIAVTVLNLNTWHLEGVQLINGQTLVGSFDYVAAINRYSNVNITLNDGTGTTYNVINPGVTSDSSLLPLLNQVLADLTGEPTLRFTFANPLTDAGGTVDIQTNLPVIGAVSALATCFNADCSTYTTPLQPMSGRVTTRVDETAPTASPTFNPVANAAGWHNADVTVTWNWTDESGGSGLDPNNCSATFTFIGEGPQATVGQCSDLAGNLGLLGSGTVQIDKTAPETTITANPPATGMSTDASFEFSGTDAISGIASFECQLDGAGFSSCESSINFGGIPVGDHTFDVRAVDVAGNVDQTPASYAWAITPADTTPPVLNLPADITVNNDVGQCGAVVDFTVTATDDSGSATAITTPTSGSFFAVGTTQAEATATDPSGNSTQGSFNVMVNDVEAPVLVMQDVTLELNANGEYIFNVFGDGALISQTDNCSTVDGVGVTGPQPYTCSHLGSNPETIFQDDPSGNQGSANFVVTITDPLGVCNATPTITSSNAASVPENQTDAIDVNATDDIDTEGSGLTYSISGGADQALFAIGISDGMVIFFDAPDYESPADAGSDNVYNIQVTVADSGGLTAIQDIAITVTDVVEDGSAPTASPTVNPAPNGAGWHNSDVTVTWNWQDSGGIDPNNCPATTISTGEGSINVTETCTDLVGNVGSGSITVQVDKVAPESAISSNPPANSTTGDATFEFGGTDATSGDASYECQLDSSGFETCASPQSYTGLANGSHTFEVRAIDVAGNVDATPASYTWTVAIPDPNEPPAVNAGDDQTIMLPIVANLAGNVVDDGLLGPVSLVWTVESGSGTVVFGDATSAVTTAEFSAAGTYVLRLTADDGELSAFDELTVTVDEEFVGELFATCGEYEIYEIEDGVYEAPDFPGNLIVGTNGGDWIEGTNRRDLILGLNGPDEIYAKRGDDVICAGGGHDYVEGGRGNDLIFGNMGSDWIVGGNGNDEIWGGKGHDYLEGNRNQDTIYGENGVDVIRGGRGNDNLFGGNGGDFVNGGNGNDYCEGGNGNDDLDTCEQGD